MVKFMSDNYLLSNEKACELYKTAKNMPIFDYHCHLSPKEIYENKTFYNLTELWLLGDHYKWRLMRAYGIDEYYITGKASDKQKFLKFAEALPAFINNPVYHWAQLELKVYFDCVLPICSGNAEQIWDITLNKMKSGEYSARNLIKKSNVSAIISTDDPADSLEYHKLIKNNKLDFEVLPGFRPDAAINIEKPEFAQYIKKLGESEGIVIKDLDTLLIVIKKRLDYFIALGATAADIAYADFPKGKGKYNIADVALKAKLADNDVSDEYIEEYKFVISCELGKLFAEKHIVMQLHTGVIRNVNSNRYLALGADSGNDSVGNTVDIMSAARLFDNIEKATSLPKTIVYTLNPNAYYPIATLLNDFAGGAKGKMQLGAAWWFLDHREGIREQLKIYSVTSGLGLFNGMLTDSRSFTSYARHDYFRRILCSLIGEWVERGEYPNEQGMLVKLVEDICYNNAVKYFSKENGK